MWWDNIVESIDIDIGIDIMENRERGNETQERDDQR
jgi:hypothetical protein